MNTKQRTASLYVRADLSILVVAGDEAIELFLSPADAEVIGQDLIDRAHELSKTKGTESPCQVLN